MATNHEPGGLLPPFCILDLAEGAAGFCSRLLADLGASVIKVEPPGGDPARGWGPFSTPDPSPEGSLSFQYHNCGKGGVTLDIAQEEGRGLFFRLLEKADVIVESFAPGHLASLGLGYDALARANPRVIVVSLTGFGQEGPRSGYRSCDLVASAFGGQMSVSGLAASPPLKPYGDQPAYVASLFSAVAVLAALRRRAVSGRGEWVDVSTQECVAATLDHVLVRYFQDRVSPERSGAVSWNGASFILPCRDGRIQVNIAAQWETLVEWMASEGMAGELDGEAWRQEEYRKKHIDRLIEVMETWSRTHTVGELWELAQAMRFPWAPVASPAEVLASPQLQARGFFREAGDPGEGFPLAWPGMPYRFSLPLERRWKRAPRLGEDNPGVYGNELGLPAEEIGRLSAGQVIRGGFRFDGILKGIRVLDFTWVLAGPYATRLLADFGAEVIKVQSAKTARGAEANATGYFGAWNRNKRSITLDLGRPEARALALRLAAISDVVVENFSPRVKTNWGFDYERLREVNPRLIMASLSGMGQTGPWRDHVAFGPTVQALSGLTFLSSYAPDAPVGLGYAYADPVTGLYGALAILAALAHRDQTGGGLTIDLSAYEAACSLVGPALLAAQCDPEAVRPQGNRSGDLPAAPYGCYPCAGKDRWCVIAAFDAMQWQALCAQMGSPSWVQEERFATLALRRTHQDELDRYLGGWTAQHTPEAVVALLQGAGVPAGIVQNAEDLVQDPHLAARRFFLSLDHPVLGETIADASPIRFRGDPPPDWQPAPLLGEANGYVFGDLLGLAAGEIDALTKDGVIA